MFWGARLLAISAAAGVVLGLAAFVGGAVAAQAPRSVWDGVFTAEQAERGSAFYVKECASCHGEGLMGQDQSPGLIGPDFLATWNGQAVGDLFEQTRKSMPKDNANAFSRQEYLDVVAFMLRANGFPAGKVELPRATADLTQLRIEQFRPATR
jgi:mono/diheme cytochrome c family protein